MAPGYFPAGRMVSVALSRLTSTPVFRRNAQIAVIAGRLRQGALEHFEARYRGKVLYPKSNASRAGRRALWPPQLGQGSR